MAQALRAPKNKPKGRAAAQPRKVACRRRPDDLPPQFRSRLTNGEALLPDIDGRSTAARVLRDTFHDLLSHCGGSDYVSSPRRLLCRRAAALECELIFLEGKFAHAHNEDVTPGVRRLDLYSRLCGAQRRVLAELGLDRDPARAKDITPLDQHSLAKLSDDELAALDVQYSKATKRPPLEAAFEATLKPTTRPTRTRRPVTIDLDDDDEENED